MLKLLLIRTKKTKDFTEGVLFDVDTNLEICDTLEDCERFNSKLDAKENSWKKVYGETAIPRGKYDIKVTYSPHFNKMMVAILNVPAFEGIRMHYGWTAKNSLGCVLCGKSRKTGELLNIGMTDFLVRKLMAAGNIGTLEIK